MELSIIQKAYADYVDQYELEHLRMEYVSADARGRIRLLKRLQQTFWGVPEDIARLAVEDPDRVVRAWYARHAGGQMRAAPLALLDLRDDPDPLVRACLVEGGHERPNWESATELERLAYLRSCYDEEFILKLFDPENEELSLSQEDRTRYALTFLAARAAPGRMWLLDGKSDFSLRFGAQLIGLMPKWPKNAGIQDFVYRFCEPGADVDIVYEHCDELRWRRLLLENVLSRGWYHEDMMALARKDLDDRCRELAYMNPSIGETWNRDRQAVFGQALKSHDLAVFQGLAQNEALTRRQLVKVVRAMQALPQRGKLSSEDEARYFAIYSPLLERLHATSFQELQPGQVEEHERTTRERAARKDSRITQAKLDTVARWVGLSLGFLATMLGWGWIGSAVGFLVGTVIYLFTGSLLLGVLALGAGLWTGISIALLILVRFRFVFPEDWNGLVILVRGMLAYPGENRPKRQERLAREKEEDNESAIRDAKVFPRARIGRVRYSHDFPFYFPSEQQEASEVDVEAERQRIERYKAALTEAGQRK